MNSPDTEKQKPFLIPDEVYQTLIGVYEFAADRRILLTRKGLGEGALSFYVEGNSLVRLWPLSATRFATDREEILIFSEDQSPVELFLQDAQGQKYRGQRIHAYKEEAVQFTVNNHHTLAGSLLLPPGSGPHPAVVLYHLANVHERDYYRIYAQCFIQQGIAVLIYDKRGHGSSTGEPLSSEIFELIEDAEAAFCFMQNHSAIDERHVGVWGMSNGGWVDLGVATRHPEVAFVINLSASGVPPSRQEQIRRVNISRLQGAQPEQLDFLNTFWELAFKFLIRSEWTADLETALQQLQDPIWKPLLKDTSAWLLDLPLAELKSDYGGAWPDGGFDPAPLYAELHCPLLCLWGEEDTVLPVAESIERIQRVLQAGVHPNWTIQVFPQANHLFYLNRPGKDEQTNEALHEQLREIKFPSDLFERVGTWARQQL
ncbi:MAG TPA: alpha/beta hydrolase [Ktedonobacteraceae bacterium]|nr:alpha/beta hydrolase [Ktedonobacteraceae bacterium]